MRADGRVATRNYIGILTSVNCSATVARAVARHFENRLDAYPNVDGVVALTHKSGCGMASDGEAIDVLRRTMAGYARHPNFFAVQVVGLGCEANQINSLLSTQNLKRHDKLHAYTIQEKGGTSKAIREGVARIEAVLPEANKVKRETVPASHLTLGLQCGGSDGYSGISANPALGAAVDLLVRHGGTAILSETPEIYGAEHLLTRRATSREVGEKLIQRIKWWEDYTRRNGNEMNNNPSPGNKAGGLTTILEKSLGAVAKGGTTNLVQVLEYAEPATAKGFVYMDTPGYDPVSATGQVAGGANMICFTTGRGSAYGCKPAPSLKLATNSALFEHQEEDMDINCGTIIDGKESVAEVGERFFDLVLETASGQEDQVRAVRLRRRRVRAMGARRHDVAMRCRFAACASAGRHCRRRPQNNRRVPNRFGAIAYHRASPILGHQLRQGTRARRQRRGAEAVRQPGVRGGAQIQERLRGARRRPEDLRGVLRRDARRSRNQGAEALRRQLQADRWACTR